MNLQTNQLIKWLQEEKKLRYITSQPPYGGPQHGMHQYSTQRAIIPFYGTVGAYNVPTIPRGYGSYQQICLDASSLTADGVGKFYIATEIELRAASVSFEKWCDFLLRYNNLYKESIEDNDIQDSWYANNTVADFAGQTFALSNNYKITVPRCVWPPHKDEDGFIEVNQQTHVILRMDGLCIGTEPETLDCHRLALLALVLLLHKS